MRKRAEARTKIVATVGPASRDRSVLGDLIRAGVDVLRFNMAHGTHEQTGKAMSDIRRIAREEGRAVAILADLQGPKIRLGGFKDSEPFYLKRGDSLTITVAPGALGRPGLVPCTYPGLVRDVRRGDRVLLDDGNMELRVSAVRGEDVETRVVHGGLLKPFKGVNLPGTKVQAPALTPRDLRDLAFALENDVDFVALSFVRTADEVERLARKIRNAGSKAMTIAKIERPEAVKNLTSILEASDGLMVARGDLGVEVGPGAVPILQKRIIRLSNEAGKPVITATQMLESMITNPRPTRAEASDVANAIFDGTSAVMLAAETAAGRHPPLVVKTLGRLIRITETEIFSRYEFLRRRRGLAPRESIDHSTVRAAAYAALDVGARAIAVFTESGRTARMMAQERIPVRIVAFTPRRTTYRQLALSWGVHPEEIGRVRSRQDLLALGEKRLLEIGHVVPGDRVVFIAGVTRVSGATNLMLTREVKAR